MCLNPKWIYKKGQYKENNYHGMKGELYEIGTYSKCGCCEICIAERANNWVVRNNYESRTHEKKCFITLTYRESPIIIVEKDFQDFMKRFRIHLDRTTGEKVRFMKASEYGTINNRPHFHAIIYGWEDKTPKFLTINKKKKIVLQSEIIQKIWGLGRTSYQDFDSHEIPYISLYNTPQETFKKAYKMTQKKLNELIKYSKTSIRFNDKQRKNLQEELKSIQTEMDEKKLKYMLIREKNTWSQGLGWEEFEKEYYKNPVYTFTEYIEDKEFVTPSPWVKRLANMGDYAAIQEMKKREEMMEKSATERDEYIKNLLKIQDRRKKELLEWNDKKMKVEEF